MAGGGLAGLHSNKGTCDPDAGRLAMPCRDDTAALFPVLPFFSTAYEVRADWQQAMG